jgi:hypothetical protein
MDERIQQRRIHPRKRRRTGNPNPSTPLGAVVTDTTGRAVVVAASGVAIAGNVNGSSTVTAGMSQCYER